MSGGAAAPPGPGTARAAVRDLPHFAALSDGQADRLLAGAALARVAAGGVVLRPGAPPPDAVRFLVSGRWTMRRRVRGLDAPVVWTDDRPGNWHGGSGLLDAVAPAEVVADGPCEILVVPRPLLDALLAECPPLAHAMLRGLRGGCELLWRAVEEAAPAHPDGAGRRRG